MLMAASGLLRTVEIRGMVIHSRPPVETSGGGGGGGGGGDDGGMSTQTQSLSKSGLSSPLSLESVH
jgi:hypothetical protein